MDQEPVLSFNDRVIAEFRANAGKVASFGDAPLLLLTSLGAKSGRPRISPMMYLADYARPNRIYVFASKAGADSNPSWYYNLVAHPHDVTVEIGSDEHRGSAVVLDEPERSEVYNRQASLYPGFAEYQAKTSRVIPVVAIDLD